MSTVRHAILVSAALLLMSAIVTGVVAAGCGDSGGSGATRSTPGGNIRTPTSSNIVLRTSGDLDDLSVSEAAVGDEMVLKGREWTNVGPVTFFLLTKDQTEHTLILSQIPNLGEVTPDEDGAVSLQFRLAESYETESGDRVEIESGQRWYVGASQRTESGGLRASFEGPLTVK